MFLLFLHVFTEYILRKIHFPRRTVRALQRYRAKGGFQLARKVSELQAQDLVPQTIFEEHLQNFMTAKSIVRQFQTITWHQIR